MWKENKIFFLKKQFLDILENVTNEPKALWGKMSFQNMIEHMSESVAMAYGKIEYPLQVDEPTMLKLRKFMLSDKPFRPGTPNSIIGDNPPPLNFTSKLDALNDLRKNISEFYEFYTKNPHHIQLNPFFGYLNFEEWQHLLCKHAWHHLNQFGLVSDHEYAEYLRNSAR